MTTINMSIALYRFRHKYRNHVVGVPNVSFFIIDIMTPAPSITDFLILGMGLWVCVYVIYTLYRIVLTYINGVQPSRMCYTPLDALFVFFFFPFFLLLNSCICIYRHMYVCIYGYIFFPCRRQVPWV